MSIEGRTATVNTQKARRAVVAGRARYLHSRPVAVEVRQPTCPPVRHPKGADRRFGEGLGARCPSYRAPVSIEDMCWWEAEARREEERLMDRLAAESAAMDRMENGLEPW